MTGSTGCVQHVEDAESLLVAAGRAPGKTGGHEAKFTMLENVFQSKVMIGQPNCHVRWGMFVAIAESKQHALHCM